MNWLECLENAIDYIESNLMTIESPDEVARAVSNPPLYLQNGFRVMTGFTVWEYVRNRRLCLAALELSKSDRRIIDIALDCGYETPESFAKAFTRFHGATPSEVRRGKPFRTFLPLTISVHIQGGEKMDYTVEKMNGFRVIGFAEDFDFETSQKKIPEFWDRVFGKYRKLFTGAAPENALERAFIQNRVGEFGVCVDDIGGGKFRYLIAGWYMGGEVPEGMEVYELPASLWAKFRCVGPMPYSLQSVNNRIWNEWLPKNREYELAGKYNIEWYSPSGKTSDKDYQSAIWIPVAEKR